MGTAESARAVSEPLAPLSKGALAARLAVLAGIVLGIAAAFAYAGGWLAPHALTGARIIDTFEAANGAQPGFRRNHAKGVGFAGFFQSNGRGVALSKASVFAASRVPVIGRFALGGGMPYAADAPSAVRSMALQFQLPGGEEWRTGMNDIPVFPVNSAQAFHELLLAGLPDPATGKPNPANMPAFLRRNPASGKAFALLKAAPKSSGFENGNYHSLNAFLFVNAAGVVTPVRWSMVSVQPFEPVQAGPAPTNKNYLFDALSAAIQRQPLHFRLLVIVGQAGDPTADASLPWPAERTSIEVGTLTIERLQGEAESPARDLNFDPLVLPSGILGSDDPLLSARSLAYSASFTRREGEPKKTSAVSVEKGAR
ncbi:MAG: catalase family peroxidase [Polyangiaceae bacterium]